MSGSSSWNTSGFAAAPNTNTMDAGSMPSDHAAAARKKAREVILALEDGKPGDADRLMGDREPKGNVGILPIDWMKSKFSRKGSSGSRKGDGNDAVIR